MVGDSSDKSEFVKRPYERLVYNKFRSWPLTAIPVAAARLTEELLYRDTPM
jgi:hypothetical protein